MTPSYLEESSYKKKKKKKITGFRLDNIKMDYMKRHNFLYETTPRIVFTNKNNSAYNTDYIIPNIL